MSKITASSDIQQVKPDDVQRAVDVFAQDVVDTVNGRLDFANNFNCKVLSVTFSTVDSDTTIFHNLGRVTQNFLVTSKTAACDIYNGSASQDANSIILRSSVATVIVTLVVF